MPLIVVEGPKIKDIDQKRQLVKKLYDAAYDIYKIKHIVVLIKENPTENVGINGELIADKFDNA